jgi:hypothetical protein
VLLHNKPKATVVLYTRRSVVMETADLHRFLSNVEPRGLPLRGCGLVGPANCGKTSLAFNTLYTAAMRASGGAERGSHVYLSKEGSSLPRFVCAEGGERGDFDMAVLELFHQKFLDDLDDVVKYFGQLHEQPLNGYGLPHLVVLDDLDRFTSSTLQDAVAAQVSRMGRELTALVI